MVYVDKYMCKVFKINILYSLEKNDCFFLSQNEYLYGEGYYNVRSHVPLVNNLRA